MYQTLFDLAGLAIIAWLPLIFVPTWKWTRRLAESAIFPVYLCALYAVGIAAVFADLGPGIMADFGSAEGVLGLLRTEAVGLVAWIHILAFDQVVGLLIYRDNMRHRFVPLPVQSVLLFLTLMLGPLGFLAYWVARVSRARSGRVAWGERWDGATSPAAARPATFAEIVTERTAIAAVLGLWRRERVLIGIGLGAFALAGVCVVGALINGGWAVPPEGSLLEALKFEVATGIYWLTLALLVPFAGFTARQRRRWVGATLALSVYFLPIETVQALRGLDPRFTEAGGVIDQVAGAVFGVTAIGVIVLFVVLALRFFRGDVLTDRPALRGAIRYGCAAAALAFGVGLAMSALSGRFVAGAGNLMPAHAAGFHGLQAVPLIALLLGFDAPPDVVRRWTHIAGTGWLALTAGLLLQAVSGLTPTQPSPALALAGFGALVWVVAIGYALRARRVFALQHVTKTAPL